MCLKSINLIKKVYLSDNMVKKGKLIAIGVNTKEELSEKKIELLKSVQVIFAHACKDEENKH